MAAGEYRTVFPATNCRRELIRLERVLEILAPRLKAEGERLGREIVVTLAEREGNKWIVGYNTIEFVETGDHLQGLLGNLPLEVSDDGVVTGAARPGDPIAIGYKARNEWEAYSREADQTYQDAEDSQGALLALFDRYKGLGPDERKAVDELLSEQLASPDENVRFDALALVREFKIRSTEPQLRSLASRLEADMKPGAPFELAKVRRILREIKPVS